ncbi:MAG: serine/threonine protein kinase [Pontiellaceae bacterium]|nr:serine/threonine protein kinase [Pontiellaceae bacterium]MBN2786322.1 serine/threonine protein kinase [Pontiellaceae bacterium]
MTISDPDQRRTRADEIFFAAIEMESAAERTAYVERVCGQDVPLLKRVERLLSAVDDSESFFSDDAPTQVTTADVAATLDGIEGILNRAGSAFDDDGEVGKQIGAYRLLRKIGEGGAGNVYVAEQSAPVRRIVAFKIIKRGMDTQSVIARFEAERQTLAMMEHSNIAHVYDAGETETGRPYFVMELVQGIPITNYCNTNGLDLRHRLTLFIQVCHAIQHAHQKGVIHRDIKPSNVLVDLQEGSPRPRVIDFGIAKAVHKGLFEDMKGHTAVEPFIGTPSYMSPEQARMGSVDLDTRSDIYSLGTLLYELLTGRTPFSRKELVDGGIDEMRRKLMEQEPLRPSTCLKQLSSSEQDAMARQIGDTLLLERALCGDLDWIVMKALEKDRERRYETVEAFAFDIGRYLNHEPVMARPPSRRYRFGKMVRRNRGLVVSVCAVLAALLAGLATSSWLLLRAKVAEQLAVESQQSEARLRVEAEAREKIARAAVCLSRNQYVEAEQLVVDCELPVIKPSLEARDLFLSLAHWRIFDGNWSLGSEHLQKFVRANRVDPTDLTSEATRGLICVAPSLVVAGDLEAYHAFVDETLTHFAATKSPIAAEQVMKMCLVYPCEDSALMALKPLAGILERSAKSDVPRSEYDATVMAWRIWALSMYEYRRGNYDATAQWSMRNMMSPDHSAARIALDHIVLAMAMGRKGRIEDARRELAAGRSMVASGLPLGLSRIEEYGDNPTGFWYDWILATLLIEEADLLLAGPL